MSVVAGRSIPLLAHVEERAYGSDSLQADPDRRLIDRSRRGEVAAFEVLVRRHRAVVVRVAGRVVGRDEAEDVAQEAFIRAFDRLACFRGQAPFRSWLLKITHNAALNALSRKRPLPIDAERERADKAAAAYQIRIAASSSVRTRVRCASVGVRNWIRWRITMFAH